jgi:hypothetical protein
MQLRIMAEREGMRGIYSEKKTCHQVHPRQNPKDKTKFPNVTEGKVLSMPAKKGGPHWPILNVHKNHFRYKG